MKRLLAIIVLILFSAQATLPGFPPGVFLDRGALDASGGGPSPLDLEDGTTGVTLEDGTTPLTLE